MNKSLGRLAVLTSLTLAACASGTVTVNPTLLADGQLIDATLAGLVPLAPPADQGAITTALNVVSGDIAALQKGTMTSADFAQLVKNNVASLEPTLLADLGANPATQAVVTSLTTLAGELLTQDLTPAPTVNVTAMGVPFDPRATLRQFVATHPAE